MESVEEYIRRTWEMCGGGPKKRKFSWTAEVEEILLECAEHVREAQLEPFHKNLFEFFKQELMNKMSIKFTGTTGSVSSKLTDLEKKPKTERKNLIWDKQLKDILLECGLCAQAMKHRNNSLSYVKVMYERFISFVPNFNGSEETLSKRFNSILKETQLSTIDELNNKINEQLTAEDLAKAADSDNMPSDTTQIKQYLAYGKEIGDKPLFKALCFRCAKVLSGDRFQSGRFSLIKKEDQDIPITKIYQNIPEGIPYECGDSYYVCRVCKKFPKVLENYVLTNPQTGYMTLPRELEVIKDKQELADIALLGTYHNVYRQRDQYRRVFDHFQGEMNLLSKKPKDYQHLIRLIVEKETPKRVKGKESRKRKAEALKWLNENNELYGDFYANAQTLFPYFKEGVNPIVGPSNLQTTAGEPLEQQLGDEEIGYFLPTTDFDADYDPKEDDFPVGQLHPKRSEAEMKFLRPGLKSPHLEALAFPKEFPGGTGSYKPGGYLTHRNWCKFLLLNLEPRFRQNSYLVFFMFDRYVKLSLIGHKRMVIGATGPKAITKPTAGELKDDNQMKRNPYDRYGSKVSANVPGSKGYWFIAQQEVHALTQAIGRHPDYFITATTRDSWEEIQRCVHHKPGEFCEKCPHENENNPATHLPTECSIAFHNRWSQFKKLVLNNPKGELGEVEHYWGRREYQKRGAAHIHMAVWVKPFTKFEGVVRAEMPRGGEDKPLTNELRELVSKYQIHDCRPDRCFIQGKKKLKQCKYMFPAPLVNETRLDETGLRKLYMRRKPEDQRVVPYCWSLLLILRAHCNIQEVSDNGWALYLTKYMTKPEPCARIRWTNDKNTTDTQRYLQMRIIGAIEANDILLQFPAKECSVDVLYLPIEIEATTKVMKRFKHLPKDPESTDVFYDSKFEKYLMRPKELSTVTYPDFFRMYTYKGFQKSESDDEKSDEEQAEPPISEKPMVDKKKRVVVRRRKNVVIRFPFLLPYGDQQEKFCLKLLLEKYPFDEISIKDIISTKNNKGTYLEECCIRGLWDNEKTSLAFLENVERMGYNEMKLREIAGYLIEFNYLSHPVVQTFFEDLKERNPESKFPEYRMDVDDNDNIDEYRYPVEELDLLPLEEYESTFNSEQKQIFEDLRRIIESGDQLLACVVGPAGTGKSRILKALCALFRQKDTPATNSFCILAPTGSAAYLIKGRTIHSMFKSNTKYKSFVKKNSEEDLLIKYCNVWMIDEMSMIEDILFEHMEQWMREFSAKQSEKFRPFADKHVILFGDPAQLPARDMPLFCGELFKRFRIYNLKTIVRQTDVEFALHLQKIRLGEVPRETREFFEQRIKEKIDFEDVIANKKTIVVSTRKQCEELNQKILDMLPGEEVSFFAEDQTIHGFDVSAVQKQIIESKKERFKSVITLKVNALVVLRRNINTTAGQVNGRLCIVESIHDKTVIVHSLDGKETWAVNPMRQTIEDYGVESYVRRQIPLELGYAATVHRVQGMTLDHLIVSIDEQFFESGQAYVALTRTRSIEGLQLLSFVPHKVRLDKFYRELLIWMDKNDVFAEEPDKSYPFPIWTKKSKRRPKERKSSGSESDDERPNKPVKRELSSPDKPNLSQKSLRTGFNKLELSDEEMSDIDMSDIEFEETTALPQRDLPITDQILVMANRCRELLNQWINVMVFSDIESLRQFRAHNEDFCESVLQTIRNTEPKRTDYFSSFERFNHSHIPADAFRTINVAPDGNCFFRAVSLQLFGNQIYYPIFRFAAILAICDNYDYFVQFLSRNEGTNISVVQYILGVATLTESENITRGRYGAYFDFEPNFTYASTLAQMATAVAIQRSIGIFVSAGWHSTAAPRINDRIPLFVDLNINHFLALIPNQPVSNNLLPAFHLGLVNPLTRTSELPSEEIVSNILPH